MTAPTREQVRELVMAAVRDAAAAHQGSALGRQYAALRDDRAWLDSGLRDDEREPWPGNPPSPYPALDRFAASMRARLVENRHKGGWQEMTPMECYSRAMDEMAELIRAIASADHSLARHEAADAANFLMMLDHALAPIVEKGRPE